VHDGVSIGGGSIEAELRCVTFGVGGRIGGDPSLGVGFLAHACSGRPPLRPITPPQMCQKSVGLGVLLSQGCVLLARVGSFILDCIVFAGDSPSNTRMALVSRSPTEGPFLHSPFLRGTTSAFDRMI
jgi:hypothetical protein